MSKSFDISSHEPSFLLEYNAFDSCTVYMYKVYSALKVTAIPIEKEGGGWRRFRAQEVEYGCG